MEVNRDRVPPFIRRRLRALASSVWEFMGGPRSLRVRHRRLADGALAPGVDVQFWMRAPYKELTFEFVGPPESKALRERLADSLRTFAHASGIPREVQPSRGSTAFRIILDGRSGTRGEAEWRAGRFFSAVDGLLASWVRNELATAITGAGHLPPSGAHWSEAELFAAVEAYLSMLRDERAGRKTDKTGVNRALRAGPLAARSRASIEFRMANISAVLRRRGRGYIKGYQPRGNVGARVAGIIERALRLGPRIPARDLTPEADEQLLQAKVRHIAERGGLTAPPPGQRRPRRGYAAQRAFKRDPAVRAWVLQEAHGTCELCGSPAPFVDEAGLPFLEVHHVKPLAEEGSDTVANAAALCPNCHRRCHESGDRREASESLYCRVARLVRE